MKNFKSVFDDNKIYFGKFALVGISGIIVNQGMLALLTLVFLMSVELAGLIAIELSIITNFLLNNYWTWSDRAGQKVWVKFFKYHIVTLVSGAVNYIILIVLTRYGMNPLISNLFGIGAGMLVNFVLNNFWTFYAKQENELH